MKIRDKDEGITARVIVKVIREPANVINVTRGQELPTLFFRAYQSTQSELHFTLIMINLRLTRKV